jgi:LysM repeat protein
MKKFLFGLVIILFCSGKLIAQDYKTHKVQKGETIESIARYYMVTPFDIYALNPDVESKLTPGTVLIIPKSKVSETETAAPKSFKIHKVKRKETLYEISKKYAISIEDIKKYNPRLYSEQLKRRDKIKIPEFKKHSPQEVLENTLKKYTVLPKEGKWRIAYKFGITVTELNAINPGIADTLQIGQVINVPNIADNEEKAIDEKFGYYTVLPKEGFYRIKLKTGLEQEQLESLNPELKYTGLKEGMVLKIPLDSKADLNAASVSRQSLVHEISNYKTKRLAILLPFRLQRVDLDSIENTKTLIEKDSYLSLSLDFHSGVLMALDSAKQLGISSRLDVFDTKARVTEISKLLSENDFSEYDAIIGPVTEENFNRFAKSLSSNENPIVSPLSKPTKVYQNVFQTIPSEQLMQQSIIEYLKTDTLQKTIIIISDLKHKAISNKLKKEFPLAKQIFSKTDEDGIDQNYILQSDLEKHLDDGRFIVFLETSNEGFVSNVTSMLNALNGSYQGEDEEKNYEREIILYTTNNNKAFQGENVSNTDLSSLQFHYPSVNKIYNRDHFNSFIEAYKEKYNIAPNKYAIRGFDLTLDILLRLAYKGNLYEASTSEIETEYIENKFRYNKELFGGFINQALYIMKYEDLKIIEIK